MQIDSAGLFRMPINLLILLIIYFTFIEISCSIYLTFSLTDQTIFKTSHYCGSHYRAKNKIRDLIDGAALKMLQFCVTIFQPNSSGCKEFNQF